MTCVIYAFVLSSSFILYHYRYACCIWMWRMWNVFITFGVCLILSFPSSSQIEVLLSYYAINEFGVLQCCLEVWNKGNWNWLILYCCCINVFFWILRLTSIGEFCTGDRTFFWTIVISSWGGTKCELLLKFSETGRRMLCFLFLFECGF